MPKPCATHLILSGGMAALVLLSGCIGDTTGGKMATDVPPETLTPAFWLAKSGPTISPKTVEYEKVFAACRSALRRNYFLPDREDFRNGVITSQPLISAQFFEPWRTDVPGMRDRLDSSIATYRRTVRFEITAQPDGTWLCTPKVLIERQSLLGPRVTAVVNVQNAFSGDNRDGLSFDSPDLPPPIYWLATGRDSQLERDMLDAVTDALY